MALLRLRRAAQITLPAELRKQFKLVEGDYVEAKAVAEGILLKPVTVVDREQGWAQIVGATASVEEREPGRKQSTGAQEQEIAAQVKSSRKRRAQDRS